MRAEATEIVPKGRRHQKPKGFRHHKSQGIQHHKLKDVRASERVQCSPAMGELDLRLLRHLRLFLREWQLLHLCFLRRRFRVLFRRVRYRHPQVLLASRHTSLRFSCHCGVTPRARTRKTSRSSKMPSARRQCHCRLACPQCGSAIALKPTRWWTEWLRSADPNRGSYSRVLMNLRPIAARSTGATRRPLTKCNGR